MVDLHTEKEVPQLLNQKSHNGQNSVGIVGKVTVGGQIFSLNVASRAMSHPKKVMMKRKPRPVQPPLRCNDEDEQRDEINSDKA